MTMINENLKEIISLRSYTRKVFDLGHRKKNYQFHIAHIHYKNESNQFEIIDTTLAFDNVKRGWKHNKASYHPFIPEYADDWFEFFNDYEGANHTIKARPLASHIKGILGDKDENDGNGHDWVRYKDAFGPGIDLKVSAYRAGLRKVICINEKPVDTSKDLVFDFELDIGNLKVKDKQGNEWDKQSTLNFKDKILKLGNIGKESYFRNARLWDSGERVNRISLPVEIELYKQGNKIYLRKTIKAEILQKAVYPLYTDHPTNYYSGAGDGCVDNYHASNGWDWVHDQSTGTHVLVEEIVSFAQSSSLTAVTVYYYIKRFFLPIDTSGIDDAAIITDAVLYVFVHNKTNTDNDGDDWVNVVGETTQPDPTTLTVADFDLCGDVNNPTEGATRIDIGDITTGAYNAWILNATGKGWIKKTAGDPYTMLGMREGHDCIDSSIGVNLDDNLMFRTSEWANTDSDPYLDVTVEAPPTGYGRVIFITG